MNILKEIRRKNGLTQTEFAEKLSVSRSAIAQIEIGKNQISTDLAKKISDIFNVSLDILLSNSTVDYLNSASFEDFTDSFYFEESMLLLDIDKIEVLKTLIKKFAQEKGLKGVTPSFTRFEEQNNLYFMIDNFHNKSNDNILNEVVLKDLHKKVKFAIDCLYDDLYNNMSIGYNILDSYYK